ncbi:MAG TPA: hypothetical protein DEQ83_01455, partial [Rhodobiaceae bacterium]|nr:hypothetical protein [Rhodobiaceae bacterium]
DEPTSDEPTSDEPTSNEPASETPASSQPQADNPLNWDWQPMSRAKRAARAGKKPNNKPNNKQATASRPAKSGDAKRQGLAKKRQQKPAPTIDPNSPFAALRNLDLSDPKPPTKPEERSE